MFFFVGLAVWFQSSVCNLLRYVLLSINVPCLKCLVWYPLCVLALALSNHYFFQVEHIIGRKSRSKHNIWINIPIPTLLFTQTLLQSLRCWFYRCVTWMTVYIKVYKSNSSLDYLWNWMQKTWTDVYIVTWRKVLLLVKAYCAYRQLGRPWEDGWFCFFKHLNNTQVQKLGIIETNIYKQILYDQSMIDLAWRIWCDFKSSTPLVEGGGAWKHSWRPDSYRM